MAKPLVHISSIQTIINGKAISCDLPSGRSGYLLLLQAKDFGMDQYRYLNPIFDAGS